MIGIQIIAIAFGLVMAYVTFTSYKRKDLNRYQFYVWESLWAIFIIVTILPEKFDFILDKLGVIRALDLFTIVAFILILFLVFHNYILISRLEKRVEKNVQSTALKEHRDGKK